MAQSIDLLYIPPCMIVFITKSCLWCLLTSAFAWLVFAHIFIFVTCRTNKIMADFMCSQRAFMKYRLPLREIVVDFYNELKSITSGYASFDYEDAE